MHPQSNVYLIAVVIVFAGDGNGEEEATVKLLETKKSLVRRSIDQLGFVKEINSLVVLSGASMRTSL